MNANWGLLGGNNALAMFQQGAQIGAELRQRRERAETDQALTAYGLNPSDPNALQGVIRADPRLGIQLQGQHQQAQAQAGERKRAGLIDIAKLFEGVTPENYGQRLQVAQTMGLDTSAAPQAYDPAWVEQNKAIIGAFVDKEDQLPGIAKELQLAGYEPGTPEFTEQMRSVITNKYAPPMQAVQVTNADGSVELRYVQRPTAGGAPQPQGGPEAGAVVDGYRFKGGNPNDPSAWEPAGGAPSQGGASFPGR